MKNKIYLILGLFLIVGFCGCQKEETKKERVLKLNFLEGDISSLHPYHFASHLRGQMVSKALFDGLTRINKNNKAELSGAEKVESFSETEYIFTLRKSFWSNGEPVTAYQYEKAWKSALSPTSDCTRSDLLYILKNGQEAKKGHLSIDEICVKALDADRLWIELARPAPYFFDLLADPLFFPVLEEAPTVFNGPFLVDSWKCDDCLILKCNPYFWDYSNIGIDRIEITMITNPQCLLPLFEKGEIDWIGNPICALDPEQMIHIKKNSVDSSRFFWLYLNTQFYPLSSPHIRRALSLSLNREDICRHILIGDQALYTPLPTLLSALEPIIENEEDAKIIFQKGLEDLQLSKETFPPLTLRCFYGAGVKPLAEYLKDRWEKIFGITINIICTDWTTFRSQLEKEDFEIGGCFGNPLFLDPLEPLERFVSSHRSNFSRWSHEEYDKKIAAIKDLSLCPLRTQLIKEAETILSEETPFIPIANHKILFDHHPKLKEFVISKSGILDFRWAYLEPYDLKQKTASINALQ